MVGIKYFTSEELKPLARTLIGPSLVTRSGEWKPIFGNLREMAPGEERTEDVLFKEERPRWFEVGVQFRGRVRGEFLTFFAPRLVETSSRMIVDARTAGKERGVPVE